LKGRASSRLFHFGSQSLNPHRVITATSPHQRRVSAHPERVAAGDHHVAVLEPDEAAVHGAARQDDAARVNVTFG
jgi:hypothetical protein